MRTVAGAQLLGQSDLMGDDLGQLGDLACGHDVVGPRPARIRVKTRSASTSCKPASPSSATSSRVVFDPMSTQAHRMIGAA